MEIDIVIFMPLLEKKTVHMETSSDFIETLWYFSDYRKKSYVRIVCGVMMNGTLWDGRVSE